MAGDAYEEIIQGETVRRMPPNARHEAICARLHERVTLSTARLPAVKLLALRSILDLTPGTLVRPDLALLAAPTGKAWLIGEVIDSNDHSLDTVTKKSLYEDLRLPRVWMIDPRYDNVEVYHGTPYGLTLKEVLAGRDILREPLLGDFEFALKELFGL